MQIAFGDLISDCEVRIIRKHSSLGSRFHGNKGQAMRTPYLSAFTGVSLVGLILVSLLSCQEEAPVCEPIVIRGYLCLETGLSHEGELLVSANPLQHVMSKCEQTSLQLLGKGYRACCDGTCCEWQPDTPNFELHVNGPCEADSDCGFGLKCRLRDVDEGSLPICAYGLADEPCDYQNFCADEHYCHPLLHVCKETISFEGGGCDPSVESCGVGLSCVCPAVKECFCYDGSDEDPCDLGTCQEGYYCAGMEETNAHTSCQNGSKGDPCSWSVQCEGKLECAEVAGGKRCVELLSNGAFCPPATDAFTSCMPGLHCNEAFDPPQCKPLGQEGEPCKLDSDCTPETGCNQTLSQCYDGSEGDPCLTDLECAGGRRCISWALVCVDGSVGDPCWEDSCAPGLYCYSDQADWDGAACLDGVKEDKCFLPEQCNTGLACVERNGETICVELLGDGDTCDPEGILPVACGEGLFCNDAATPPICSAPGEAGAPCKDDAYCEEDHVCLLDLNLCTDGGIDAPCLTDADCHPSISCDAAAQKCGAGIEGAPCPEPDLCFVGLVCSAADDQCHDGETGDPCLIPEDCAVEFSCVAAVGQCYDGGEDAPCDAEEQCQEGLGCIDGICESS